MVLVEGPVSRWSRANVNPYTSAAEEEKGYHATSRSWVRGGVLVAMTAER